MTCYRTSGADEANRAAASGCLLILGTGFACVAVGILCGVAYGLLAAACACFVEIILVNTVGGGRDGR